MLSPNLESQECTNIIKQVCSVWEKKAPSNIY
jgi:hypothetical protein